jgi:hypothetical protein
VGCWDVDERGHGVASAAAQVPDLDRLREAMLVPDWVTEEADAHLLPHVERLARERGWAVERAELVDAVLEVDVAVPAATALNATAAAFALIGTFAECSTHVVATRPDLGPDVEVLVTTGVLDGDSRFAPHGHVVRLTVRHGA